jgi:hypothetical protein
MHNPDAVCSLSQRSRRDFSILGKCPPKSTDGSPIVVQAKKGVRCRPVRWTVRVAHLRSWHKPAVGGGQSMSAPPVISELVPLSPKRRLFRCRARYY